MITSEVSIVFYSQLKGRRYLSKSAAINAEARALIEKKHPTEKPECGPNGGLMDDGWHWSQLERSDTLLRRVRRMVRNGMKGTA